jgi:hypothetical protein
MLRREQGPFRSSTTLRHCRIWWDHYHAMQPADHVVTWDEFRTAFIARHIPEGLIERKLNEFVPS